jgi:DNA-binding transcriptional LysR family regulator
MPTTEMYVNERNGSTTWESWRACAKRSLWQRGWMPKTPAIESRVSVGTATVAMILNGLGWSLRQLYLVPQYFANKPVEHWALCWDQGRDARVTTV